MRIKLERIVLAFALCFHVGTLSATDFNIIPQPLSITETEGFFTLSEQTQVAWRGEEAQQVAQFFVDKYRTATGRSLSLLKLKKERKRQKFTGNVIQFLISPSVEGREAYRLEVKTDTVTAVASTGDGLFWALQTLLQLCPPDIENQAALKTAVSWQLPAVVIDDAPRFAYRGVHLDPCRHFLPVAAVKKQIDMLATYKVNRLHFHLTDDQGWRIEIRKYPELTSVGASRVEAEGNIHKGYYTQQEIRDIVEYARQRHMEVVPELEMPGHGLAAIAAYPELSCQGDSITPRIIWGVEDIVMCPGKEIMFNFLQDVIDEMTELFPSPLFHIGGDESPRQEWAKCDSCQARMKAMGFQREAQLQDYVIERISAYLQTKGKTAIGWDEILEGGNLEPSAIVMSWRGEDGGITAARKNHRVIMTPSSHGFYFDHYQGDFMTEPTSIGGYAPLEKVYAYDPVPDVLKKEGKEQFVLGVQANNWSEYTLGPSQLENRLFPRALALAEIAWSQPEKKDYKDFLRRLDGDATTRLTAHNINFNIPQPELEGISSNRLAFTKSRDITLTTTRPLPILYETDGTSPSASSPRYMAPIRLYRTSTVKTAVLLPGGIIGPVRSIYVEKQEPAVAQKVKKLQKGLMLSIYDGDYRRPEQLRGQEPTRTTVINDIATIHKLTEVPDNVRNVKNYAATAEGYFQVPADGVYEFSSCNAQVYIDGTLQIDNSRVYAPRDTRENVELALQKGYHRIKVVFLGGIFGGWPTYWNDGTVKIRPSRGQWKNLSADQLYH